jgi:hypothetical protein
MTITETDDAEVEAHHDRCAMDLVLWREPLPLAKRESILAFEDG